jgi:hypothetical protein
MGWPTRTSAADQEIRPAFGKAGVPARAFGLLAELLARVTIGGRGLDFDVIRLYLC